MNLCSLMELARIVPLSSRLLTLCIVWAGLVFVANAGSVRATDADFFEKKVRPVLIEHCYECHSGDSKESGLKVDSLAALLVGGERGPALVPGKPNESVMIQAIRHDDTLQMPPERKLPQSVINDLMLWVKDGAVWPDAAPAAVTTKPANIERKPTDEDRQFWAFRPPVRHPIPHVADPRSWAQTPIDRFVLQKLTEQKVSPNAIADKRTLIRRASLDLIGLPPTPDEVGDFLADQSPEAFERVIDRLLASPRYGERWGRHWLDVARYGDSNGLDENLAFGSAWRYRDYVIEAFNSDRPYDEFLQEQLAGDLLPASDQEDVTIRRIVATGYLSLGAKMLAEDDPVKMEMDIIDEQLDTLGKAVLGMTLGCARCHDHKFDPISMHDYYALAGIFKSSKTMDNFNVVARWQERPLAVREVVAQRDAKKAEVDAVETQIVHVRIQEAARVDKEAKARVADYMLAADRQIRQEEILKAARPIAEDELRRSAPGTILIEADEFVRGNVMRDKTTYGVGIGVLVNDGQLPNFTEYDIEIPTSGAWQIDLRYAAAAARPTEIILDGEVVKPDAAGQVTGSWTPDGQKWFVETVIEIKAGKHVLRLDNDGPFPHIDKIALAPSSILPSKESPDSDQDDRDPLEPVIVDKWAKLLLDQRVVEGSLFSAWWKARAGEPVEPKTPLEAALLKSFVGFGTIDLRELAERYQAIYTQPTPETTEFKTLIDGNTGPYFLAEKTDDTFSDNVVARLKKLNEQKAEIERAIPALPEAMSITEGKPQNLKIHLRGSHTTLGDEVARRMPRVFSNEEPVAIPAEVSGRLELARWLTQPDHPLTARVLVNRIWQAHLGDGLVRSPDNFGKLGELPTHPELLDWLATELVRSGWSIKHIHRLILSSATWQQSTDWNESAAAIDPENKLLWRMNRRRLEAEAVRDSLLAIGGDLDDQMGGSLLPTENRKYVTSTANINVAVYDKPRRTIYLPIVRSALFDYLTAFDFGDPSSMSGQRDRTTVAPQALFLMNSLLVAKESDTLAKTLLASPDDDRVRITQAFERFYSRPPTESEVASSLEFVGSYEKSLAERGIAAEQCRPAAWKAFCRALMSTNEFLYVN